MVSNGGEVSEILLHNKNNYLINIGEIKYNANYVRYIFNIKEFKSIRGYGN